MPPDLVRIVGAATLTVRLPDAPTGSAEFRSAYAQALGHAEHVLADARLQINGEQPAQQLSPDDCWGVAGHWARQPSRDHSGDAAERQQCAAVLRAFEGLDAELPALVLPAVPPMPSTAKASAWAMWRNTCIHRAHEANPGIQQLVAAAITVGPAAAESLRLITVQSADSENDDRPYDAITVLALPDGDLRLFDATVAVLEVLTSLRHWIEEGRKQALALGLVISRRQQQQVALRIVQASLELRRRQIDAAAAAVRTPPAPITFPPPPTPAGSAGTTFDKALELWRAARSPTVRTFHDAKQRLIELGAHCGHARVDQLTPEQAAAWKASLLNDKSTAGTVKRKLALVRAVMSSVDAMGLLADPLVLHRLQGRGIRSAASGEATTRRAFEPRESRLVLQLAREISHPVDRWLWPLGLATGARLEELIGLRKQDLVDDPVAGWALRVVATDARRLKNGNSARIVPIVPVLQREGFIDWAMSQPADDLFLPHEPPPLKVTASRSRCASLRLGKWLRKTAKIDDKRLVFHSCRHTVTTAMESAGVDRNLIQQIVGHAGHGITDRYIHTGPRLAVLVEAMAQVDWSWWP